jgi:hypothetical protein
MVEPFQDPHLGWDPLVKSIELHVIPADHITIGHLQAPALDACLHRAQAAIQQAAEATLQAVQ